MPSQGLEIPVSIRRWGAKNGARLVLESECRNFSETKLALAILGAIRFLFDDLPNQEDPLILVLLLEIMCPYPLPAWNVFRFLRNTEQKTL